MVSPVMFAASLTKTGTGLEKKWRDGLGENTSVESAIKVVTEEINFLRESVDLQLTKDVASDRMLTDRSLRVLRV